MVQTPETIADLPSEPEQLRSYSWAVTLAYKQLQEKYTKLLGKTWGRSSEKLEKINGIQIEMDEIMEQPLSTDEKSGTDEQNTVIVPAHTRRRSGNSGRNSIPEELITDVELDIAETEKTCGCCGKPMSVIDRKPHLVVERKPAEYTAKRYWRPVYGCSCCKDTVRVAEPVVLPIAKGLAGPELLLFVITSKYQYHLPLYRIQRQIYHESRIWFTRSTLASWVRQVSGVLERLHKGLLEAYRRSRIKHADESPFQVKIDGHYRECWMWTGLSGDGRTAVFLYNMRRTGAAAKALLAGGNPGDYLMIDDCPSYNSAVKELRLIVLHCMVHIRRKFVDALKGGHHLEFNRKMLLKIAQLYRLERFAKNKKFNPDQRGALRAKYSTQILQHIKKMLLDPGFPLLPQSDTGKAIAHFRNNWDEATRFTQSGELPIDNSANERIIRPFAIGRNNWGQAGSENGARWMAILYSIITTCKLNAININEYLSDVLLRLPIRPPQMDVSDLLPVQWHQSKYGKLPDPVSLYPSQN
jgi:transposase